MGFCARQLTLTARLQTLKSTEAMGQAMKGATMVRERWGPS